ncbi:hypothetical protein ACZ91_63955 [Streptomyces regensis]|nr:hypothetical protein ACZ91_63955 [Streptomyces regensis]
MADLVSGEAFLRLFEEAESSAYRLETRVSYGIPDEDEPYAQFLAGEDPGTDWFEPWLVLMRSVTSRGTRVERVRIIDSPPSDYLRFELWGTPHNLSAGEDIRYLDRSAAVQLGLPTYDYWVFDDRLVARLQFGAHDRFLGVLLSDDPEDARRHMEWRSIAWEHAVTFSTYMETATSR